MNPALQIGGTDFQPTPIKRRTRAPIVRVAPLCDALPSLRIEKHRRAHSRPTPHFYRIEGLGWKGLTLAQLYEIHMRLGQFLEGEKQPTYLKI